ncbi:glycine dehydrogenase (aminomethyl-transferring) [Longibacter salinarum]|uniref:Glycine dehydrogenase (decarboxylating) n=1 Tax=Longibacter salinarum TaxID=1850348 RepID=A0A2A8D067_9BACT|nr:aminomethyl-transferring glycine dehydrogenase [Longibacter salinarum]PEN14325.1 glycine dehydrogenase (aminomethyl-transferring) [Longibacter salinarum]
MAIDLSVTDRFASRHIGPSDADVSAMLDTLGVDSLDALVDEAIPASIRSDRPLDLPPAVTERALLNRAQELAGQNDSHRSFIGMGYSGTVTPPVIQRDILENPSWYTQYTPYQAEIAQGRLEALLNFQTMVIDLTGLEIANASLLDEATAAAEAMMMLNRITKRQKSRTFFVAEDCHPQTISVVQSRAEPIGVNVVVGDPNTFEFNDDVFGVLLQYPTTDGSIENYRDICERAHENDAYVTVAADLLALTLLTPPGEIGADVAVGSTQRFGVPLGFGGPHAAYFATKERHKRQVPGRMIGVSKDAEGNMALRMALQTREQHIRRGRATSNICTAQVLLAVMASMYAVYHGPEGLKDIATRVHDLTKILANGLEQTGHSIRNDHFFDTLRVDLDGITQDAIREAAEAHKINLRYFDDGSVGVSLDETVSADDLDALFTVFGATNGKKLYAKDVATDLDSGYDGPLQRETSYLDHPVFHKYQSETELTRYIHRLARRDLSLTQSMIPLGSCTMKLNPTAALMPISMPGFTDVHPFAPSDQTEGYRAVIEELSDSLAEITGFDGVSLQPNSGASGEYAGLLVIRAFHRANGDKNRTVCLIPESAHGTNPASATMAGMKVVTVDCDDNGDVDLEDLTAKAEKHSDELAALMVTYPSTHGVFEDHIQELCDVVHEHGGQVYMDGANMNAQVGLCRPGEFGIDVCHLNLHKTFSIPHGGGGPGVGPICTAKHLSPFLPGHPIVETGGDQAIDPVSAAPYGSALITLISWAYIKMLGADGLTQSTKTAILNANYIAKRLSDHYDVVYSGDHGRVAHEFILDLRPFRKNIDISEQDVAKRLMDFGYHAPTMSWPVVGTLMVEPTESESKAELDRFCQAMINIRTEIEEVENESVDLDRSPLKQAPHTAEMIARDGWDLPYSRERAAFPADWTRADKFWPTVRRVDDAFGDRNLICACPPMEAYQTDDEEDLKEALTA